MEAWIETSDFTMEDSTFKNNELEPSKGFAPTFGSYEDAAWHQDWADYYSDQADYYGRYGDYHNAAYYEEASSYEQSNADYYGKPY